MLIQPYCGHCFAEMRALSRCAERTAGLSVEKTGVAADESLPMEGKGVCTKKPCLSTSKIDFDHLQKIVYIWHDFPPAEAISSCFTSVDAKILFGDSSRCPVWLRLSVLLI